MMNRKTMILALFVLAFVSPAVAEVCWERGPLPETEHTFSLKTLPKVICVESYSPQWNVLKNSSIERHERLEVQISFWMDGEPRDASFPSGVPCELSIDGELLVSTYQVGHAGSYDGCSDVENEYIAFVAPLGSKGMKDLIVQGIRRYTPDICHAGWEQHHILYTRIMD